MSVKWGEMTLRDRVLASHGHAMLYRATPFSVSSEASYRIGCALKAYPELVVENLAFARPPFKETWIEFDVKALCYDTGLFHNWDETIDSRCGFLFSYDEVREWFMCRTAAETVAQRPRVTDAMYLISTGGELDRSEWPTAFKNNDEALKLVSYGPLVREVPAPVADSLAKRVYVTSEKAATRSAHPAALVSTQGEVAVMIALLLAINQPGSTTIRRSVPKARGLVRGRKLAYFGHTEVDIVLDAPPKTVLGGSSGTHASPRWHAVRGHWYHRGGSKGCDHAWTQLDSNHFECEACGRKRTWREVPEGRGSFMNGGVVDQTRRVRTYGESRK